VAIPHSRKSASLGNDTSNRIYSKHLIGSLFRRDTISKSSRRPLPRIIRRECGEFCNHSSFSPVIYFIVLWRFRIVSIREGWLGLLSLCCSLLSSSCADDRGSSGDPSQHQRHHGGDGGRYRHGHGGMFDQSNPSGSPSTVPGQ